jgi:hypothetical protein
VTVVLPTNSSTLSWPSVILMPWHRTRHRANRPICMRPVWRAFLCRGARQCGVVAESVCGEFTPSNTDTG